MNAKKYEREMSLSINIIEENLRIDYPVKNIIKRVNVEKSQFIEIFKFYTGYTISQYQRKRVLSEASKEILRGKKIIDVALDFGYKSSEAFSRAFKNEFNISPKNLKSKEIEIKLLSRLTDKIINEKSELIEDISFNGSKVIIKEIKETFEELSNKNFIEEYSFNNTSHIFNIKLNGETLLNYLESFDEIMLPAFIYDQMINFHDYKQEDLETVLALIYISKYDQYQEEILLKCQMTLDYEEIDCAIKIINTYYDINNPRKNNSNYYFGLNEHTKQIIETLKQCK